MNKKSEKRGRLILTKWIPLFIWALVIFMFSEMETTPSSRIIWQDFVIKKSAHVIEYAIFSILLLRTLRSYFPTHKALIYSFIFAVLYGISDEFHQSFTPGREPTLRDVLFDTSGAALALFYISKNLPYSPAKIRLLAERLHII